MYSIKQASIRSGVSVPLIRAWERRYGVVKPKRAASGYRMYDDDAIATLIRVRELTASGWTASEASRAILAGEVPVEPVAPETVDPAVVHARQAELVNRFLAAATRMDTAATGAILDEMFAQGSYEAVIDDLIMPALVAVGRAWSDGEIDVAAEHAASAAVQRRLAALYEAAGAAGEPRVVVGMPPGSRHELGALAFAVAVRRKGVGVLYLGADVPISSWLHVIRQNRTRLAVIGVVQRTDRKSALEIAAALREELSAPTLAVGGSSADWDGAADAGVVVLPSRISDAAALAARLASGTAAVGGSDEPGEQ